MACPRAGSSAELMSGLPPIRGLFCLPEKKESTVFIRTKKQRKFDRFNISELSRSGPRHNVAAAPQIERGGKSRASMYVVGMEWVGLLVIVDPTNDKGH